MPTQTFNEFHDYRANILRILLYVGAEVDV